jgi:hypothetical protein
VDFFQHSRNVSTSGKGVCVEAVLSRLSDWYIANETEAEAIVAAETEELEPQWPHMWIKNIGIYELMWLSSTIRGTDYPDLSPVGRLLYETEDKEIGIFRVMDEFIEDLVRINHDEIDKLAEAWSQSEPMVGASPAGLAGIIRQIADFAAQATSLNTPILTMYVV